VPTVMKLRPLVLRKADNMKTRTSNTGGEFRVIPETTLHTRSPRC
jgi:hypothetical protein